MKVGVVGLGLIGGSVALDLKARKFATTVYGTDSDKKNANRAKVLGLVDKILPLGELVTRSDLVILAIPVDAIVELLPQVLSFCNEHTTITDMGSTKDALCAAVAFHPRREHYVPSHPMAGTENSGPDAAVSGLFDGKTAVICDKKASGKQHLARIEKMYQALNMRVLYMGSKDHDLHTAFVSHLSHISSFILANTVLSLEKDVDTIFDLAGGGFESTVRLAKSSPDMWAPIFRQNYGNIITALDSYIRHLQNFHAALLKTHTTGSDEPTVSLMKQANKIRRVLRDMAKKPQKPKPTKKGRS